MSKSFTKVIARYSSAQLVSNMLRLISGFMVVRLIEPELYGMFSGVAIYLGYILLSQGGIVTGLRRELPYELGRGNDAYARELASSTFVLSLFICTISALIFSVVSVYNFINGKLLLGYIYLAYTVIAGTYFINKQYLPSLYRTNNDFDSLSKQNIRLGIGNLVTVSLVYFFSIYGLIIRGVCLAVYEFFLLYKNKPYKLTLNWHLDHYKKLFKVGLPIFSVGQIRPLWITIQNNILFSFGGATQFGYYALVNIINGAIGIIPSSFSQVIYPHMTIQFGKGREKREILKQIIRPIVIQFLILLTIAIVGTFALPYLIPILLPKYTSGISAAQWALFIPVITSLGAVNNYYNVIKKQKYYFISLASGAIVGIGYILTVLQLRDFSLDFFPQAIIVGTVIQISLSLYFLIYKIK